MLSCAACKVGRVVVANLLAYALLLKHLAHLLALEVYGRHNDMAGLLVQQLQYALAKVGLHHVYAVLLEVGVHAALLRKHRLRLNHLLHPVLAQNVEHRIVELVGILSPMHYHAAALELCGKLLKIVGKVRNGMALYLVGMFAQVLPFGQTGSHGIALLS